MWFVISFTLGLLTFIITTSWAFLGILCFLLLGGCLVYGRKRFHNHRQPLVQKLSTLSTDRQKQKKHLLRKQHLQKSLRRCLFVCCGVLVSAVVVIWNEGRFTAKITNTPTHSQDSCFISIENYSGDVASFANQCQSVGLRCEEKETCFYIGDMTVVEHQKPTRFVVDDDRGRSRLLYVQDREKDSIDVGDSLFVATKVVPSFQSTSMPTLADYHQPIMSTLHNIFSGSLSGSFLPEYAFDFSKWMKMKGYYGMMYQPDKLIVSQTRYIEQEDNTTMSSKIGDFVSLIRVSLYDKITEIYGNNKYAGLILGMLIGDKSMIPKQEYETFIESNLVHIIAVSGGNIVMLVVFLSFVFGRIPFYLRQGVLLCAVVLYAGLCGADSSVIRATIMGGLGMIALLSGRDISLRRLLGYAWVGMLLRNPLMLIYDVGFLLSFGAIIGLVWMGERAQQREPTREENNEKGILFRIQQQGRKFFKNYISPTLGASIGVLPFLLFFMQTINLTGMVANVFVLPVVPLIMVLSPFSAILSSAHWLPFARLGKAGVWCTQHLVEYVYWMSEFGARVGVFLDINAMWLQRIVLIVGISIGARFIRKKTHS